MNETLNRSLAKVAHGQLVLRHEFAELVPSHHRPADRHRLSVLDHSPGLALNSLLPHQTTISILLTVFLEGTEG